ncbi:MAG: ExbD/TolR family protein [Desulfopila sp.]
MIVHPKKRARLQVQPPLTALIDIVFLLLIYFLLTTNFLVEEGIKVKLPQAQASAAQSEDVITIFVDATGQAYLQDTPVKTGQLYSRLGSLIGAEKDKLVVVKADREVVLNHAVKVMDIAKAAGAGRLSLATEKGL